VLGSGWPKPDPLSSVPGRLIKILMGLDQSNAPGVLAWSGSIRSVGLGFLPVGFGFFHVFLNFLAMLTSCSCYLNLCAFQFLYKIPKKLLYVLEAFLYCFVMLLHVKIDKKKMNVHFFYIFVYFCAFFWWISCIISVLIQYHMILMLGAQFCDAFAVD